MTSNDLTRDQVARLHNAVRKILVYHNRLVERMTRMGFPTDDPLWVAGVDARNKVQDLMTMVHYAGCEGGVGRPSKGNGVRDA